MNVRTDVRLPYAMQIGSGTVDALPGLTYTGLYGRLGWGAQYRATIHLGENGDGYRLGDVHDLTAWGSVLWTPWLSTSLRLLGRIGGSIDGIDDEIVGPVQTADPDNYGGERLDVLLGVNLVGPSGWLRAPPDRDRRRRAGVSASERSAARDRLDADGRLPVRVLSRAALR